ncbi:MAG: DUF4437 domain-containing protein [Gammaproteobacteria bacterium]|nr:DUF4437 domain-containing protein [Gammaproteobacteria bacterium]NNK58597.1 DUF4437 domain-containing protein [Desulfofustis sp.]
MISSLLIATTVMSGVVVAQTASEVVERSDIQFQPLNPARGDASPQAGVLWGDIKKDIPSGALIVFADGFSSPPHIHNITYRAVVISGAVHNDDPDAESMWMGPGSFWTQPAGETHITAAAEGSKGTAFLEILEGPYLVQPSEEAFDNGERPVNVDARNIVWLDSSDVTWFGQSGASTSTDGPEMAFLWGSSQDNQKNGTILKLPTGSTGELYGNGSWLRAVVIQGPANHQQTGESGLKILESGSYFGLKDGAVHKVTCKAKTECLIYVSTKGRYSFIQI